MTAEVYTKPNCPFCVRAKALLEKRGVEYTEISAVEHREALIERVTTDTGAAPRTVPQVYLDGKHIGGFDDLSAHYAAIDAAAE
ncbi:MAG: glutaredoxin 3 [Stutzerimonas stutzeri]|nr:MAG: glutaredoxin 3 [Stutzerimonas stutzeri]